MKHHLWVRAAAAAFILALAAPSAAQEAGTTLAPGEVLLKVQAEGSARSRPDLMLLSAGVVTTGPTAREALAANNQLANRLIQAVRAQGVAAADIKTQELSVEPRFARQNGNDYSDDQASARITGYVATNTVALTLRDLTKGPALIDALFQAGANQVRGPSFELADPAPSRRRAREAAVAAALEQATTYAEALHMRIGRVLQVSERSAAVSIGDSLNDLPAVRSNFARATPLEPGDLTTRITIWIDYALVPAR
jgi:uncharacterized protein YggE